ncbi:unnamed protein product [Brassica napus]|uniref:(rape) hypothetical protein n=1 Tax=Brassica napus TaxID=3708 RepID=A0A816ZNB9_BRANA|nr:unnamed protein product [Brassica napus]
MHLELKGREIGDHWTSEHGARFMSDVMSSLQRTPRRLARAAPEVARISHPSRATSQSDTRGRSRLYGEATRRSLGRPLGRPTKVAPDPGDPLGDTPKSLATSRPETPKSALGDFRERHLQVAPRYFAAENHDFSGTFCNLFWTFCTWKTYVLNIFCSHQRQIILYLLSIEKYTRTLLRSSSLGF